MNPVFKPFRPFVRAGWSLFAIIIIATGLAACGTPTPLQTTGVKACEQQAAQLDQGQPLTGDALLQRWGIPGKRMTVRNFDGAIWEYPFINAGVLWGCYGYVNPAGRVVKMDNSQIYLGEPRE